MYLLTYLLMSNSARPQSYPVVECRRPSFSGRRCLPPPCLEVGTNSRFASCPQRPHYEFSADYWRLKFSATSFLTVRSAGENELSSLTGILIAFVTHLLIPGWDGVG